jgi:UAA transporter family
VIVATAPDFPHRVAAAPPIETIQEEDDEQQDFGFIDYNNKDIEQEEIDEPVPDSDYFTPIIHHRSNRCITSATSTTTAATMSGGGTMRQRGAVSHREWDDAADVAAGTLNSAAASNNQHHHHYPSSMSTGTLSSLECAPPSVGTVGSSKIDLQFFEDLITEPVLVLGVDISHLDRSGQFVACASGLFGFSLLYGYLQELLSVTLCSRQLGLFLAMLQFAGYTVLAYVLRNFVYNRQQKQKKKLLLASSSSSSLQQSNQSPTSSAAPCAADALKKLKVLTVPAAMYIGLSLLRAVDLAMTNLAMQYINYPAKTLMKSSRVVFTMLFGVLIQRKVYKPVDYLIVLAMVMGLAMFMHADANSSAVFHHMGVLMLTVSLVCDGAISNMSETIMSQYGVGQDEVSRGRSK